MNHRDIAALMAGIAPVVRDYVRDHVSKSLDGLSVRVATLETREPIRGEKGEAGNRGEKGDPGEKGEKGDQGEKGEQGLAGDAGIPGEPGKPGDPGNPGEKGEPGLNGNPGDDGRDGLPGRDGLLGLPGEKGRDGIDGKDGFSLENFSASSKDGGRTITFKFASGERVDTHEMKTDVVLDRGVYKQDQKYEKGDGVTFGGSFFIAQEDTDTKPETGTDWRLAVKRGRDGRDGKPGEKGDRGLEGKPGPNLRNG